MVLERDSRKVRLYANLRLYLYLLMCYLPQKRQLGAPSFKKLHPHWKKQNWLHHLLLWTIYISKSMFFFFPLLFIPSIHFLALPNIATEMLTHIAQHESISSFLHFLEVLWTSLGRTLSNLIKDGPTLSIDWNQMTSGSLFKCKLSHDSSNIIN